MLTLITEEGRPMEKYESLNIEVIEITGEDVITTSPATPDMEASQN